MVRPFVPGGQLQPGLADGEGQGGAEPGADEVEEAASSTATVGVSARVRTARATDADASLKPFRKANAPAQTTTRANRKMHHVRIP